MAVTKTQQEVVLPKYQEDFLKDMLKSTEYLTSRGMDVPEYRDYIAGLSPEELEAFKKAEEGIGAYQPYLDKAEGFIDQGAKFTGMGADVLEGTGAEYDPSSYEKYMDPYMEDVVSATEKQFQKQKEIDRQKLAAGAGGAFGGSRPAIQDAMLQAEYADKGALLGAQMRSQGFQTAQTNAQTAFENAQRRAQNSAQIFQALGQGVTAIGGQIATLGGQQQQMMGQDVQTLLGIGGAKRAQDQAGLSADLKTFQAQQQQPYQELAFASDIFQGVPSSQSTMTSQYAPDPSLMSQLSGIGMGVYGMTQSDGGLGSFFGFPS